MRRREGEAMAEINAPPQGVGRWGLFRTVRLNLASKNPSFAQLGSVSVSRSTSPSLSLILTAVARQLLQELASRGVRLCAGVPGCQPPLADGPAPLAHGPVLSAILACKLRFRLEALHGKTGTVG
jgi:hypothetical protein